MTKLRLVLLAGCLLTTPFLFAQEEGGDDAGAPAEKRWNLGFHVGLDLGSTEANGLGLGMALVPSVHSPADDNGDTVVDIDENIRSGFREIGLDDVDSDIDFRAEAGITWARAEDENPYRNRGVVRVWIYDPGDDDFAASRWTDVDVGSDIIRVGGITPLMGTARQVRNQRNLPYAMTGSGGIEASSIDLLWTRQVDFSNPGWEFEWSAGLRYLSFDVDAAALYSTDTPEIVNPSAPGGDSASDEAVRFSSETTGWGPIVGGRLGYRFGESRSFGLHGEIEVSGLQADTDWSYQATRTDREAFVDLSVSNADLKRDGGDRTITTMELELGASYRFSERFLLQGGFRLTELEDVWTHVSLLGADEPDVELLRQSEEGTELRTVYIGIGVRF